MREEEKKMVIFESVFEELETKLFYFYCLFNILWIEFERNPLGVGRVYTYTKNKRLE